MEFGLMLPTSGRSTTPERIVRFAKVAEQLGYSTLWTYERLLRPTADVVTRKGETKSLPDAYSVCYEPLETLSYVAGVTSHIKLGTSVVVALFHSPLVLARRFATLDQFSNGRVIAGIGQGWMKEEFEAVDVPVQRQGSGMDEMIEAMRACWGSDPVSYIGNHFKIAPSEINPKPIQAHLPIFIGAMTPNGIKRAARIADGIIIIAESKQGVLGLTQQFRHELQDLGRDPSEAKVIVLSNGPVQLKDLGDERTFLTGSPRQIFRDLESIEGSMVNQVIFDCDDPSGDVELIKELKTKLDKLK